MLREEAVPILSAALGPRFADNLLVVGVSGGPDSLALLHLLAVGGPGAPPLFPRAHLRVAHLDHALRPHSAADAAFVARTSARWGLRCALAREDVGALARAHGISIEAAGRRARYAFLARVARAEGSPAVAVAHHAGDQAETVLLHLLRGSGLGGLGGMAPAAPLPGAPDLLLLRPLLRSSRAAVEAYCAEHGLRPLADASNEDVSIRRNRIRHELLPALAAYNPRIVEKLGETAALAAADNALLEPMAAAAWDALSPQAGEGWLAVDLDGWRALPLSLRRRTLRQAIGRLRGSDRDLGFQAVEQARAVAETGDVGAQATLPGGLALTVGYARWLLARPGVAPPLGLPQLPAGAPFPLAVPGRLPLENGWVLETAWRDGLPPGVAGDRWRAAIDGAAAASLQVRGRRPGERFRPLGMDGKSKKVKEMMIDAKIPARARARWPLVAGPDHLLWIAGHRLDRRARVRPGSARVVELRCRRREPAVEEENQ